MYCFLLIFHFALIIVGFGSIILLSRVWASLNTRFLMITMCGLSVYNTGYFVELISSTREMAVASYAFQYTGFAFATLSFLIFICNYSHISVRPIVWDLLFVFDLVVVLAVSTCLRHDLYYTSIEFVEEGLFPHLETGKAPLFWIFTIWQSVALILSALAVLKKRSEEKRRTERTRLLVLFFETLIPIVGIMLTSFMGLGGYDSSPALTTIMGISVTLTIVKGKFVDIVPLGLSTLYDNGSDGIIIVDNNVNYRSSNKAAQEIFPEMEGWESGMAMKDYNLVHNTEYSFSKDERYYNVSCVKLIEGGSHVGYVIMINDVTDLRRQVREMEVLKEEADSANAAKSAFLANMSHEIRTPLNAIIGMAELSENEPSETVVKDNITQIKSAGKMLLDIVSDVLDFSKAESGKLEIIEAEYSIKELLNAVINVENMRIGDKPVEFIVDIDPTIPSKLYGDDVRIRQVLMNFLSNAEKFTQTGHVKLTVDCTKEGHGVVLHFSIEDTGQGIRKEDVEKLFKPFNQMDARKNRKLVGTGLGLAISAQLVDLMRGTYNVESEYEKGSTFSFSVPNDIVDTTPIGANYEREKISVPKLTGFRLFPGPDDAIPEKKETEKKVDISGARVLVVDDNKVNVKVLCAYLKRYGIIADTAYSGPAALEAVNEKTYNLIFMDHMMPDMDGIETTSRIREMDNEWKSQIPIVACTANVIKGVEEMFLQAGMNGMIQKPIQLEALEKVLFEYLKNLI